MKTCTVKPAPTHSESSGRFTERLTKVVSLSSKLKDNFVNLKKKKKKKRRTAVCVAVMFSRPRLNAVCCSLLLILFLLSMLASGLTRGCGRRQRGYVPHILSIAFLSALTLIHVSVALSR